MHNLAHAGRGGGDRDSRLNLPANLRQLPGTALVGEDCQQQQVHGDSSVRSWLQPLQVVHTRACGWPCRYGPNKQPPIYTYYDGDSNLFGARKPHLPQEFTLDADELITQVELQWDPISMRWVAGREAGSTCCLGLHNWPFRGRGRLCSGRAPL